ncbi:PREDICTED: uncharacterized protein LOC105562886 [Vollenhovia emeryi]|uniref:uncharacterized protein LOC105562886 n=1 Tax=Vollenhovia emeryi TaxID=411798 RepID=UPI0005F3747B|nr:PREDICTED: uncharacterized protein LOC105562886 [Vollenhovia emeryi]
MRLDPFGLTGPPTSKKWRGAERREQKEEKEQQLWLSSSSSSSSTSFVECIRSDDGGVFAAQHHHEARYYGHGPDKKAGTATAFRISRDSASRGEVRARARDHHEDGDDNDSDVLRARTRIVRDDRPSPRRRAPRFARRARRRGNGAISEEGSDVATSAVSFVDVHAYTAYSDDRDDDDDGENDDDDDNEGRAHCERKRVHGGSHGATGETYDEYEEDKNDDKARISVSYNPRDEDANKNAPREDYIRTEMDASNRGVFKSDEWASRSSSFDGKRDRERVDGYDCEYPTVDEVFDGGRKEGRCSDNTAWFQKPITRRKGRGGGREGRGTGDKPRVRRSYYRLLLFVLYLLAWPLLCSSSPSGHPASTFAQNPTLAHTKNPAQRGNATPPDTSLFSSTVIEHQYQHSQQYVQGSDHNADSEHHRHHQQQQQRQKEERQEQSDQEESEQRHPYNEYSWEVNQMNPWLSACDLAGPAPTDLQGSCGAPPLEVPKHCPKPCKNASEMKKNYNMKINWGVEDGGESGSRHGDKYSTDEKKEKKEQCLLYLEESDKKIICQTKREDRKNTPSDLLLRLRLRHCCEHPVFNALAPGKDGPLENVLKGGDECNNTLDKLLLVDALAARLLCEFEEVLARYDCAQPYSVIHNCTHCKEAYRKWVCSSLVPYFAHRNPKDVKISEGSWIGPRLRPCRSICQTVEERCPYFLPGDRAPAYPTQYAGEPTFLCRDPNIPEIGEQAARAMHSISDEECCFHENCEDANDGICPKKDVCKKLWKHHKAHDPGTAPQCDMNFSQSGSTGPGSQAGQPETSTDRKLTDGSDEQDTSTAPSLSSTTTPSTITVGQKDTAFCGSGRIGSISSASSPGRPSPPIVLQLFWLCSILITLPANALQYNAVSWSPSGFLRLIGSGLHLSGAFDLRRVLGDLCVSFGPRSTGIYRLAVVRCLLFVLGMPGRAVMKCRCRGWWWWRSWRRSSSRHFRWKFLRRFGAAARRSVLRVSIAILEIFLKYAAKYRCRDWWWLWRRWRKCDGSTEQYTKLVPRRKHPATRGTARRRRGRRRDLFRVLRTDVGNSAGSISRKDPP